MFAQPLKPQLQLTRRNRRRSILVSESDERRPIMTESLQLNAMRPEATLVETAGHTLTAAKCSPAAEVRFCADHGSHAETDPKATSPTQMMPSPTKMPTDTMPTTAATMTSKAH